MIFAFKCKIQNISKSPLDFDENLLAHLSSEDLLSQENGLPKLIKKILFLLSMRLSCRFKSKLHRMHTDLTFGNVLERASGALTIYVEGGN